MITFLIITNIFIFLLLIGVSVRLFQLSGRVLELEDVRDDEIGYLEKVRSTLARVHGEIDKVSQYPVTSGEPIIKQLVKTVKSGRDDVARLLDTLADEGPDDKPNKDNTGADTGVST